MIMHQISKLEIIRNQLSDLRFEIASLNIEEKHVPELIEKAAKKFGVERVILPTSPDVPWLNPYSITKQTAEKFSKFFSKEYNVETVSLKFGKIYGPRERWLNSYVGSPFNYQFLIPTILIETLRGNTVQIYGDGNQKSEYIFVHDVIESFVRTLKTEKT